MTPVLTDLGPAVTLVSGLRLTLVTRAFIRPSCNYHSTLSLCIVINVGYNFNVSYVILIFFSLFLHFIYSMCTAFLIFLFIHGLLFSLQNIYITVMRQGHPTMITS